MCFGQQNRASTHRKLERPKQSRYDHRAQQIAGYILKEVFTIVMLVGQKYTYIK